MPITQLSASELQEKLNKQEDIQLLDVREADEFAYAHIEGSQWIPLSLVPLRVDELDAKRDIVVICHHGVRSMQASAYLERCGFSRIFNLTGGIDAWSVACDSSVPRY